MGKKLSYFMMVVMTAMSFTLTACGDDDDATEGGNGGTGDGSASKVEEVMTQAGTLADGVKYTMVSGYDVTYNDNGTVANVGPYEFSYGDDLSGSLMIYLSDQDISMTWKNIKFNKENYVSSFEASYSEEYYDESYEEKYHVTLTYDEQGHLSELVAMGTATENGYTVSSKGTMTFNWKNGNLIEMIMESGNSVYSTMTKFKHIYAEYSNKYKAMMPADICGNSLIEPMALIGLMGKGSVNLAEKIECTDTFIEDGESYSDSWSYKYEYGFNDDGSVSYIMTDNNPDADEEYLYFGYSNIQNAAPAKVKSVKNRHFSNLFGKALKK